MRKSSWKRRKKEKKVPEKRKKFQKREKEIGKSFRKGKESKVLENGTKSSWKYDWNREKEKECTKRKKKKEKERKRKKKKEKEVLENDKKKTIFSKETDKKFLNIQINR
jgi:hypothetical protein